MNRILLTFLVSFFISLPGFSFEGGEFGLSVSPEMEDFGGELSRFGSDPFPFSEITLDMDYFDHYLLRRSSRDMELRDFEAERYMEEMNQPYFSNEGLGRQNCVIEGVDCPYVFYNLDQYKKWINEDNLNRLGQAGRTVMFSSGILDQAARRDEYRLDFLNENDYSSESFGSHITFLPSVKYQSFSQAFNEHQNSVINANNKNKEDWQRTQEEIDLQDKKLKELANELREKTEPLRKKLEEAKNKAEEFNANLDDQLRDIEDRIHEARINQPLTDGLLTNGVFLGMTPEVRRITEIKYDLQSVEWRLLNAKPTSYQGKIAKGLGLETSLIGREHLEKDLELTKKAILLSKSFLDVALGFMPGVSLGKDGYEVFTGMDIFGNSIGISGRVLSGVGLVAGLATAGIAGGVVKSGLKSVLKVCNLLAGTRFFKNSKLILGKGIGKIFEGIKGFVNSVGKLGFGKDPTKVKKFADNLRKLNWKESFDSLMDLTSKWKRSDSFNSVTHVIKGDITQANKIKGGLHTNMGLKDFFKKRPDIENVAKFERLGNGVKRVEMPQSAFNSRGWSSTQAKSGIPGGKTLFPESWNMRKIFESTNEVIRGQNIPQIGRASFSKIVDGVKIKVNLRDGKVISSFPTWVQ